MLAGIFPSESFLLCSLVNLSEEPDGTKRLRLQEWSCIILQ